ncbi:MAG: TonB family protein [Betaproteobacteria bacterium]|nr:TonB family protein [Betaproteobacteria bacterium]
MPQRFTLPGPRRSRALPIMLGLSVLVHAGVLLVRFVPLDPSKLQNLTPPLEVVLVNSKSAHKPHKADALAQASLNGGGNTEADRRAKTNLPVIPESTDTDELSLASRKVERLESEMRRLVAQVHGDTVVITATEAPRKQSDADEQSAQVDSAQKRTAIARLEAQIAKEWDHYQKLPRRKFIGARTEGVVYAQYVDDWRQKIERIGTHNYPEEAKRLGIYGTILLTVSIRADGSVERVEIDRSSGHPVLDRAARRIVQLAAPFTPFPPDIRKEYDILSITRNWAFTRSDGLVSQ